MTFLPDARAYDALYAGFRWAIPARYNIGTDCATKWAKTDPERLAILDAKPDGRVIETRFGELDRLSNRFAHVLEAHGVMPGERVAVLLPQSREVAVVHLGTYKAGAIAMPLAVLFGVDAIAYRLTDAAVSAIVTDAAGLVKLAQIPDLPALKLVLSVDGEAAPLTGFAARSFDAVMGRASDTYTARDTTPDDPAMMIYTSGTTGHPKGALHGHRVLLGHVPGVQLPHEFAPLPGDRFWTPADWAWAGGLLNMLLPGLKFGVPVVARKFEKFDPDEAYHLMATQAVRNIFVPPTALKMLRAAPNPKGRHGLALRSIGSGGESLGAETYQWGREALGLTINEFYGQTECNLVLASCAAIGLSKPGAIGKPVPGHRVAVIREDGSLCEPLEQGQIAVARPDPVMFLGYWKKPEATEAKFIGDWMTTGDQGVVDTDGYVTFIGRDDDVITSAGYRIGPGEIEDCLLKHPAVALAAAVGKPDPLRTEIVKAFVVLKPGYTASETLGAEIRAFVRGRLSAHEYPREIAFVADLPLTTTGKVIRRLLRAQG